MQVEARTCDNLRSSRVTPVDVPLCRLLDFLSLNLRLTGLPDPKCSRRRRHRRCEHGIDTKTTLLHESNV